MHICYSMHSSMHACMHACNSFIHSFMGVVGSIIRSVGVHAYIQSDAWNPDSRQTFDSTRLGSTRLGTSSRATTTTMANACVDDEDAWYTDTDMEEEDSGSEFDENSPAVRATGKGKKAAATVRHPRGTRRIDGDANELDDERRERRGGETSERASD